MKKRKTAVMMAMLMTVCALSACGKKDEPAPPAETEPMIEVGQQNLGRVVENTEDGEEKKAPENVFVPPVAESTNVEYSFSTAMINTNTIDFASPDYKNSLLFMTNKEYQEYAAIISLPLEEQPKGFKVDKRLHIDGEDFQDFSTENFNFRGFAIKQDTTTVGYAEFFDNGKLVEAGAFDDNRLDEYVLGGIYTDYTTVHYYDDDMNEVFPPEPTPEPTPTPDDPSNGDGTEIDAEISSEGEEEPTATPTPTDAELFNVDDYTQYRFDNFFIFDKSIYCGNGRKEGVLGTSSVELFEGGSTYNKETMIAYFIDTVNTIVVNYEAGDPNGKNEYERGEKVHSIYFLRNDINS